MKATGVITYRDLATEFSLANGLTGFEVKFNEPVDYNGRVVEAAHILWDEQKKVQGHAGAVVACEVDTYITDDTFVARNITFEPAHA